MANSTKSVAQEVRETVKARLKSIREEVAPLIKEESELVELAPGESVQFSRVENKAEPEAASSEPRQQQPGPKRRRRRQGGTRAEQAVKLITANPGISASDVAEEMKIQPNYLYRVLGDLEKEGQVRKEGRQYFPAAA